MLPTPLSAVILNKNCFHIKVKPNKDILSPIVISDTAWHSGKIRNMSYNVSDNEKCKLKIRIDEESYYSISCCMKTGDKEKKIEFAHKNIKTLIAWNLHNEL